MLYIRIIKTLNYIVMKNFSKFLFVLFILIAVFATRGNAQATILLTVEDGCEDVPNCYYKVTMIYYKNQNCSGEASYCYYETTNCSGFTNSYVDFNSCDVEVGWTMKIYVQKMSGTSDVCWQQTSCLEYYWGREIYLHIQEQ